jgi:hypothetical protein
MNRATKIAAIGVLAMLVAAPAFSQVYFGAKVPLGFVAASIEDIEENRFAAGIDGIVGYRLGMFGIEGNLGLLGHFYTAEIAGADVSTFLTYLRFGAMAKAYPIDIVYLAIGADFSYLIGQGAAVDDTAYAELVEMQDGPIFLATEGGVEIPIGPNLVLPVGLFYNVAIANIPEGSRLMEIGLKAGVQYRY